MNNEDIKIVNKIRLILRPIFFTDIIRNSAKIFHKIDFRWRQFTENRTIRNLQQHIIIISHRQYCHCIIY